FLGPKTFKDEELFDGSVAGIANGLAWTSVGGEMLNVEVIVLEGNGKLELTGSLGEVMKESAKIAISFIRSISEKYGLDTEFYKNKDIHIHFPEGAVPKDGPSAGITVATAIFSSLSGIPVSNKVAMTGEVTLNGRVLPIGGLKEKATAALKHGIKTVIIPKDNLSDTFELDKSIQNEVKFLPVSDMEQVLEYALLYAPDITSRKDPSFVTVPKNDSTVRRIGQ
ncbi:MAG: endopeptidase La, partial [Clostridia bacterium]|nr:endopeptidase La [Clostridia bacterium]